MQEGDYADERAGLCCVEDRLEAEFKRACFHAFDKMISVDNWGIPKGVRVWIVSVYGGDNAMLEFLGCMARVTGRPLLRYKEYGEDEFREFVSEEADVETVSAERV